MHSTPCMCVHVCVLLYLFAIFLYIRCTSDIVFFYIVAFVRIAQLHLAHVTQNCVRDYVNLFVLLLHRFFFFFCVSIILYNGTVMMHPATKCNDSFLSLDAYAHNTRHRHHHYHERMLFCWHTIVLMLNQKSHQSFSFCHCCAVNNGITAL